MKQRKPIIYAVTNQKGGVAKTSTTVNVAAGLFLQGKKVLLIDLEPQADLTFTVGAENAKHTVIELFNGTTAAADVVTHLQTCDIIAGTEELTGADNFIKNQYVLKKAIEPITKNYDFIFIDTPPALSALTVNALTAADRVIIPAQADAYSLKAIKALSKTIAAVKEVSNPALIIDGIVLCRYFARSILTQEMTTQTEELAEQLHTKVYASKIREAAAVKEAQLMQQNIFAYDPKAKVTSDYKNLTAEILAGTKKR